MAAPTDYAGLSGAVGIYRRGQNDSSWTAEPNWMCSEIVNGSRDRISTATIRFNRDKVLRSVVASPAINQDDIWAIVFQPPSGFKELLFEGSVKLIERTVTPDADTGAITLQSAAVLWADDPDRQIFGRYMSDLKSPNIPASPDGKLVHDGSLPAVFNPNGKPNRSRRTARDVYLDSNPIFGQEPMSGEDYRQDVHYFVDDDGFDVDEDPMADQRSPSNVGKWSWPAYYWTFAQAAAYVLNFHAEARALPGTTAAVKNNGVNMFFGYVPGDTPAPRSPRPLSDSTTAWGAIIGATRAAPLYKFPTPPSEDWTNYDIDDPNTDQPLFGGADDPSQYAGPDVSAAKLLRARCHNLSIEGMNVLQAIGAIFTAAGLGWWIDSYIEYASGVTPPVPPFAPEHVFRVFTPGGRGAPDSFGTYPLPNGVGDYFKLKLEPSYTPTAGRTMADITNRNNSESLDVAYDSGSIVNAPIILKAPTRYEVTCMLRPGWRPIWGHLNAAMELVADNAIIDNVNPNLMVRDDPLETPISMKEIAFADAFRSLPAAIVNPQVFFGTQPGPIARRIKTLFDIVHANGLLASQTADVMRKWIIPTDRSYPKITYARDYVSCRTFGMPWQWADYTPVNWSLPLSDGTDGLPLLTPYEVDDAGRHVEGFIMNPLPDTSTWPTRRRKMLPCLTCDSNGESLGVVVEVSFNKGDDYVDAHDANKKTTSWYRVDSFRVLQDELGIYFTWENPFDLVNLHREIAVANYQNLNPFCAYINHTFRVRATFSFEASSTPDVDDGTEDSIETATDLPDPSVLQRCRIINRRDRYKKTVNLGQFKDRVTNRQAALVDYNAQALLSQDLLHPADNLSPSFFWHLYRAVDQSAAARAELSRQQAMSGDWRVSGKFTIPWIETNAKPGSVVEKLDETSAPTSGAVARGLDFRMLAGPAQQVGPMIAGTTYTFDRGGFRTTCALADWRSMQDMGPV